jgi:hypothetical protein
MKKILLAIIVLVCIILLLKLYREEKEYITTLGVMPQAVVSSVSGSIVGAGILMILFSDCNV